MQFLALNFFFVYPVMFISFEPYTIMRHCKKCIFQLSESKL